MLESGKKEFEFFLEKKLEASQAFSCPPIEADTEEWLVSTRRKWRLFRSFLLERFFFQIVDNMEEYLYKKQRCFLITVQLLWQ